MKNKHDKIIISVFFSSLLIALVGAILSISELCIVGTIAVVIVSVSMMIIDEIRMINKDQE